jgi:dimethylamine/trimethylamine dehydrogenase
MADQDLDILFSPIAIGPVIAKNRFFVAPHGNGYGYRAPQSAIELRRTAAQGGWAVVSTEQTEIHPTSDMSPFIELRNWDDGDLPVLGAIVEAVHEHGALAALELSHSGLDARGLLSGARPIGPSALPVHEIVPPIPEQIYARAMDSADIAEFRQWHRDAVRRGLAVRFDIVYVYASLYFSLLHQFLATSSNLRGDDYGGALLNRARLLREVIEDTLELCAGKAAVAVRLTLDELLDQADDHRPLRALFQSMGELPDLWDLGVGGMGNSGGTARFDHVPGSRDALRLAKSLTTKPVIASGFVGTGAEMAQHIRDGVTDMISAARPSIAEPFLPRKVKEGREDEIVHCIRCNLCVAGDMLSAPVQCTQNPSFGEEWTRGWRYGLFAARRSDDRIAIVGAGPAGLEAAGVLGERGYAVTVFEAASQAGGRSLRESRLPGLQDFAKIHEDRLRRIARCKSVELRLETPVSDDLADAGDYATIALATGASWSRAGQPRNGGAPPPIAPEARVLTPDDILAGMLPRGTVVIYDDDHYYMGGVIAELLAQSGCAVTIVTPAAEVSVWTHRTMDQPFIQRHLMALGVRIVPHHGLRSVAADHVEAANVFSGEKRRLDCTACVLVTIMTSNQDLLHRMRGRLRDRKRAPKLTAIGDAFVPGIILSAIRQGHEFGRGYDPA